jgi:hypothetical protein
VTQLRRSNLCREADAHDDLQVRIVRRLIGQTRTFVVRECQAHGGHSHHSAFHPLPHKSRCKLGQSGSINSEEMK